MAQRMCSCLVFWEIYWPCGLFSPHTSFSVSITPNPAIIMISQNDHLLHFLFRVSMILESRRAGKPWDVRQMWEWSCPLKSCPEGGWKPVNTSEWKPQFFLTSWAPFHEGQAWSLWPLFFLSSMAIFLGLHYWDNYSTFFFFSFPRNTRLSDLNYSHWLKLSIAPDWVDCVLPRVISLLVM